MVFKDTIVKKDTFVDKGALYLVFNTYLAGISLDTLLSLPYTSNMASIKLNSITIDQETEFDTTKNLEKNYITHVFSPYKKQ